jgi:Tfp pilus assembly protein PilN
MFGPNDELQIPPAGDSGDGASEFTLHVPEDEDFDFESAPTVSRASKPTPAIEPIPERKPAQQKERRRRNSSASLGIYVTPTTVYGALLQDDGSTIQVLRRFARQRNAGGADFSNISGTTADTVGSGDSGDVQIKFGQSGDLSSSDLFLDSEFGDLANLGELDESGGNLKEQASPVVFELKDLLDECATAGYDKPATSFCIAAPDVDYVEVLVPEDRGRKDDRASATGAPADSKVRPASVKRDRLLSRLAEEYDGPFEKERVAFIPMTAREGVQRFLAIVPTAGEPLASSLELLREQSGMRTVPFRGIDAEVPILMGLTRWAFPPNPHENTAIVRVSGDNTLVILLQGDELHHQEHMLSVTTLDGPDTICSRVLLQQDVQGIGTVHQVIVVSEEREDELVRGFSAFYPDARVEALRRGLREHGVTPPAGDQALSARALPAVGAAMRQILDRSRESWFEDVNMLPKRLRRSRPKLDLVIAWHTLVATVLLFFTVLFFIGLFFAQQKQISERQERLAAYPADIQMSPQALQARIDSLQSVYMRITATLNTIDSLLVGSDRWSRSVSRLARATESTGGTWVDQWTPQGGNVQLSGHATSRDRVVQFADRMRGNINELKFAQIRDFPVYTYVLTAPVPSEMPEVARYLREQVEVTLPPEPDPLGGALAGEETASAQGN